MENGITQEQIDAVQKASGHSIWGGSSMPRIIDCPASVGVELKAGLQPESIYAAKGSVLHGWSEKAMKSSDPRRYIFSQNIEIEDTSLLIDATEYVQGVIDKHPLDKSTSIRLEDEGNLSAYGLPEVYGTMDVVITSPNRVDVIDYKFGYGVAVYAKDNAQLISYLGMAVPFIDPPDTNVRMYVHICQPTKMIFDCWEVDHKTLYSMILGDMTDAIALSKQPNPPFGPSEKACRFCDGNMACIERHKWLRKQSKAIHEMSKDPTRVSNEQWAVFLDGWESLKAAASQVQKHAVSEIMAGREFPGYKLIGGRSQRKFVDGDKGVKYIKKHLGDKAYKAKERPIVSLAQAEKIMPSLKKKDEWKSLIYKPEGAAKLVKATAKGKALTYGTRAIMDSIASGQV